MDGMNNTKMFVSRITCFLLNILKLIVDALKDH